MVVVNIGGDGTVAAAGETHAMVKGDMLYLGMGSGPVDLRRRRARFYILSRAGARHPPDAADPDRRGGDDRRSARAETVERPHHLPVRPPRRDEACQLVVGMTQLEPGSVWNTMPAHVHDRRMEAYLYIDLAETARVAPPDGRARRDPAPRLSNEEGAISPPWSIHSGAGTSAYAFIWAMAGDNVDYKRRRDGGDGATSDERPLPPRRQARAGHRRQHRHRPGDRARPGAGRRRR